MTLKRDLHVTLASTPIEYNRGSYMYTRHLNLAINTGIFWLKFKLSFDLTYTCKCPRHLYSFLAVSKSRKKTGYFIDILEKVISDLGVNKVYHLLRCGCCIRHTESREGKSLTILHWIWLFVTDQFNSKTSLRQNAS